MYSREINKVPHFEELYYVGEPSAANSLIDEIVH